jgi:hypothetical protein
MNVIAGIDAARERWNVLEHPFYTRWEKGELTREELQVYAGQYRYAVTAVASAARTAASPGDEEAQHIALWDDFASRWGPRAPAVPETRCCRPGRPRTRSSAPPRSSAIGSGQPRSPRQAPRAPRPLPSPKAGGGRVPRPARRARPRARSRGAHGWRREDARPSASRGSASANWRCSTASRLPRPSSQAQPNGGYS